MRMTGIWMDKKKAIIITIENEEEKIHEIPSNMDDFNVKGGSGTRFKGGPQDVVQDSRYLEHEKNQFKRYFNNIIPLVESADQVVVFGPAQAGIKFVKYLSENKKQLSNKVLACEKTDHMTMNQLKAWVKQYFESNLDLKV